MQRFWSFSLVLAVFVLLTGADGKKTFHGGHGTHGGEAPVSTRPDYERLFQDATPLMASAEGRETLDEMVAAYGGEETLSKLESACLTYEVVDSDFGISGSVVRKFGKDRRYRVEWSDETRVLQGNQASGVRDGKLQDFDGPLYLSELYSYLVLEMPGASLNEHFSDVRFGRRDDDPLQYLYFQKPDSLLLILGVDPESHLIRKSEGVVHQGPYYMSEFSDHVTVDGQIFPGRFTNISLGLKMVEAEFRSGEVNCVLDPEELTLKGEARN